MTSNPVPFLVQQVRTLLSIVLCWMACGKESLFGLRREFRECCIDEDARQHTIMTMRDECWRSGL